jgi:proteasome lid subunit RPN8/RPN11
MKTPESSRAATLALLERLKAGLPDLLGQAQVVGRWVWVEFATEPSAGVCERLRALGFHWNAERHCWQHPCGAPRGRCQGDPRGYYEVTPATALALHEAPLVATPYCAKEYKVVTLRDCPLPVELRECDTPEKVAEYWHLSIATHPYFNPECECLAVLLLNTRRRVKGHHMVSHGTLDTILVHPREVFRVAIVANAAVIVVAHNHPSGDPTPSEADIKVTRDLIRAGQLLRIEVLDHVIVGRPGHASLRSMGYFAM